MTWDSDIAHVGARLADRLLELRWIERRRTGRVVTITESGAQALADRLGVDPSRLNPD